MAPKGPRDVATGGAKRNPWNRSLVERLPRRGRGNGATVVPLTLLRPFGARSQQLERSPRVSLRFTRGYIPAPLWGALVFLLASPAAAQTPFFAGKSIELIISSGVGGEIGRAHV